MTTFLRLIYTVAVLGSGIQLPASTLMQGPESLIDLLPESRGNVERCHGVAALVFPTTASVNGGYQRVFAVNGNHGSQYLMVQQQGADGAIVSTNFVIMGPDRLGIHFVEDQSSELHVFAWDTPWPARAPYSEVQMAQYSLLTVKGQIAEDMDPVVTHMEGSDLKLHRNRFVGEFTGTLYPDLRLKSLRFVFAGGHSHTLEYREYRDGLPTLVYMELHYPDINAPSIDGSLMIGAPHLEDTHGYEIHIVDSCNLTLGLANRFDAICDGRPYERLSTEWPRLRPLVYHDFSQPLAD